MAGELSGNIESVLTRLAVDLEKLEALKRKIRKSLWYPGAVCVVATLVATLLLLHVVPQFEKLFEEFHAELPYFTRCVVALSQQLHRVGGCCCSGSSSSWLG